MRSGYSVCRTLDKLGDAEIVSLVSRLRATRAGKTFVAEETPTSTGQRRESPRAWPRFCTPDRFPGPGARLERST
jgi:hypothetical protein